MKLYCRTCLTGVEELEYTPLNNFDLKSLELRDKLTACVLPMAFDLVADPVICAECCSTLETIYEFQKKCVAIEEKIHERLQTLAPPNNCLNITDIIEYHESSALSVTVDQGIEEMDDEEDATDKEQPLLFFKIEHVDVELISDEEVSEELPQVDACIKGTAQMSWWQTQFLDMSRNSDTCPICKTEFGSDAACLQHNHTTLRIFPLKCCKCAFSTSDGNEFYKHSRTHVQVLKINPLTKFNCDECGRDYTSISGLKRHKLSHVRLLSCNLCEFTTPNSSSLSQHRHKHLELYKFRCKYCQFSTKSEELLAKHLKLHENCNMCEFRTTSKAKMQAHMRTHRPFKCDKCDITTFTEKALVEHMRTHTDVKTFICEVCGLFSRNKSDLANHIRARHSMGPKKYKCTVCNFECHWRTGMKKHIRTHTGHKPYVCEVCGLKFSLNMNLKRHMLIHLGVKRFKCDYCDYRARQKETIMGHVRSQHMQGVRLATDFACEHCDYSTVHKYSLNQHLKRHVAGGVLKRGRKPRTTYPKPDKPLTCSECTFTTVYPSTMVAHTKRHSGKKDLQCGQCTYRAAFKSCLDLHMQIHTGAKRFQCGVCNGRFRQKPHLISHMRTHTGEKPYQCQFCEYRAAHSANLLEHEARHTGANRFKCKQCDFKTPYRNNLRKHVLLHTGEKPHKCGSCEYRCMTRSNLTKHELTHK